MNKNGRELPLSTVRLIAAFCGEYFRMKEALDKGQLPYELVISYQGYINAIYLETERACGLVGCQVEELILDIAKNRGYRASALQGLIGRGRYTRAKSCAIRRIAERLLLAEER